MGLVKYTALLTLLAGCASSPELLTEVQPVSQSTFQLIDDRKDINKQTRVERVGHNLVRYILGDDRVKPSVPVMLESYLHKTGNGKLVNKNIRVVAVDIRVYRMSGSNTPLFEKQAYISPATSPGAAIGGLLISDLMDIGFEEKRIEVEIEGLVDGKTIKAGEYDYYTFGSPEKKALKMLDIVMKKFSDQMD
ncbi:MAG: hypothetical protein B7Y41_15225 [Hydrogenophilales bacterium 28-61-23]|nr:MAG: hypothetical protein B7Y41_15225 [Hydrogenophilales bacterium 28-61-23]